MFCFVHLLVATFLIVIHEDEIRVAVNSLIRKFKEDIFKELIKELIEDNEVLFNELKDIENDATIEEPLNIDTRVEESIKELVAAEKPSEHSDSDICFVEHDFNEYLLL